MHLRSTERTEKLDLSSYTKVNNMGFLGRIADILEGRKKKDEPLFPKLYREWIKRRKFLFDSMLMK